MRTKVPAQAGRGENGRVDADGEQPTGRAKDGVVHGYVVGALGESRGEGRVSKVRDLFEGTVEAL